jgi:hypothetical protein
MASYFLGDQPAEFARAWRDAVSRGPTWRKRARQGRGALIKATPELSAPQLWRER